MCESNQWFHWLFNISLKLADLFSNPLSLFPYILNFAIGYEAFIGMLKWATPLNPEKTLETLLESLYADICLSKLDTLQTDEYIHFRTRHAINAYPFDNFIFRPHHKSIGPAKDAG